MLAIFFATYVAVFMAEIVGDKLLYTTGILATRYKTVPIMIGMGIAFMAKMSVAVAVGEAIAHLPRLLVAAVTTTSFLGVAYTVWRKPLERKGDVQQTGNSKAAMVSFAAIFFSEWGDVGQITAAAMAAKFATPGDLWYSTPLIVWFGAVGAMVTKGALAASIGASVRRWIQEHLSPKMIRFGGVSVLLALGFASVGETLGWW